LPAVKLLSRGQGKTICLINTTDFVDGQWVWGHFYAPFLRRCDQLVYGCEAQQRLWTMKYRLPTKRSTYIYNGVDSDVFSPAAIGNEAARFRVGFGIPEGAIVIGSVGRFAPEKNFEILIQAIASLHTTGRDVYLVLVGDGNEKSALQAAAGRHGILERIVLPGVLKDVRPAFSAMDVFVLPSRAVETFSNAALEAMAMARPVVLTNIGGASEMVEHGKSGYLFEVGNVASLVHLLIALYDSGALRDRIGHAARNRVMEQFQFGAMLDGYKALLDSAMH
jgi:glycosyltransferase involved in cell wall biosynthesis